MCPKILISILHLKKTVILSCNCFLTVSKEKCINIKI